jgi:FLYWCH zinc finger domain
MDCVFFPGTKFVVTTFPNSDNLQIFTTTTTLPATKPKRSYTPIVTANSSLEFIKSPWSTPCLIVDEFMFNCHSVRGPRGYWRCHNYSRKIKEERCRARCVIIDGQIKAMTGGPHNHPAHTQKIEKIRRRNSPSVKLDPPIEALFTSTAPTTSNNEDGFLDDDEAYVVDENIIKIY